MPSRDVHAAISRVTFEYARAIDDRDWDGLRAVFTDICEVDFRSWSGAPAATMASDVWVQALRSVTGAFDATQHLMTNLRIEEATDEAETAVVGINEVHAQHWFSGESMAGFGRGPDPAHCTLGGYFTNRYVLVDDSFRITGCRFTLRWRTGDESLFALARQRP
ncbi:MAG: nuclear transport factor 2 family protein [Ilumatobacteraceae bacterium]